MHSPNDQPKTDQATDPSTNQPTDRRVSVAEAAVLLDLSEAAVRSRLKRGTLRKEKAKDGTVLVVLGTGGSTDRPTKSTVRPNDRSSTGQPADQGDLIAGLVQRVPELGPAQEPREGHVTDSEEPDKGTAPSEEQETSQRRSWWRAFFGLE